MPAKKGRCCGNCRYWEKARPATKIELPNSGRCGLDGRLRFKGDMKDCFGFKAEKGAW